MEPIKVLMFGTDDIYSQLKPYYDKAVETGKITIDGYAIMNQTGGVFTFTKIWNASL